jgi:hypothetical protein
MAWYIIPFQCDKGYCSSSCKLPETTEANAAVLCERSKCTPAYWSMHHHSTMMLASLALISLALAVRGRLCRTAIGAASLLPLLLLAVC